jgi:hypothetical protein
MQKISLHLNAMQAMYNIVLQSVHIASHLHAVSGKIAITENSGVVSIRRQEHTPLGHF